ncbi:MAG TPA: hypothetical protein VGU70_09350 [Methylobacterium sp.]|jgi:hypothetical protein|nr:hypothetical protein [Methylobacterium sp.]
MATPPKFVVVQTDLGLYPSNWDGQTVDPTMTYVQVQVITAPGARNGTPGYIRLDDLTAYLTAVAKGQ